MKNKLKERGITLIALVITIIVLLILAAVGIATLTGENGILTKAGRAKEDSKYSQALEEVQLAVTATKMDYEGKKKKFEITDACASDIKAELVKMSKDGTVYVDGAFMYAENRDYLFEIDDNMKVEKSDIQIVEGDTALWEQQDGVLIAYKGDVSQLDGKKLVIPNYVGGVRIKEIGANLFAGRIPQPLQVELEISNGIKVIREFAFPGCSGLIGDLIIPNSINNIGMSAFSSCTGFTGDLTIGDNVTTIGNAAFASCENFRGNLSIGKSVERIEASAFFGTKFTGDLIIPESVTSIGGGAFSGCTGFTGDLTIKKANCEGGAFSGCTGFNGKLTIGTTNIDENFAKNNLGGTNFTELELLDTVQTIGNGAFYKYSGFTGDLIIPNSVTTIGGRAFSECSGFTGDLTIGNKVTTIGYGAFSECSGFTGDLIIPNSVTTIGDGAFSGCSGFTGDLTIGNKVTEITTATFAGCTGFSGKLTVGVQNIPSYFMRDYLSGINFSQLEITEGTSTIGSGAFNGCSGFTGDLIIPNSVTTIGGGAFYGCSGFTGDLIIPNSVTTIGDGAFNGCSGFTGDLTIGNKVTTIGGGAFYKVNGFNGKLTIGLRDIPSNFMTSTLGGANFTEVEITEGTKTIGASAFESAKSITTVRINANIDTMGSKAFAIGEDGVSKLIYVNNTTRRLDGWSEDWVNYYYNPKVSSDDYQFPYRQSIWRDDGRFWYVLEMYNYYYYDNNSNPSQWSKQRNQIAVIWADNSTRQWYQPRYNEDDNKWY